MIRQQAPNAVAGKSQTAEHGDRTTAAAKSGHYGKYGRNVSQQ